jgi:hypothetical protein
MIKRVASLAVLASALAMSFSATAGQPTSAKPMFLALPNHGVSPSDQGKAPPPVTLAQWSGSFTDLTGHTITYKMAGGNPASTNTATHISTYLIPVIMVYGATNGNMTFDPTVDKVHKKKTVMQMTKASPIFDNGADFMSGSIDCGQSQYIDAYQRCNFWSSVQTNTGYHVLLDIVTNKKVKPLTINVTPAQGSVITNPFGSSPTGTMSINTFDAQLIAYLTAHTKQITPDTFPFFISRDIYLTSGGCCIGGYHSAHGAQTYGYTTYDDEDGVFSEDVSAMAHEVGEWMDDPFTNNHVNCQDNSILENGDPLVPNANYGTFAVTLNKFTYHPQSLVFLPYFGAPTSTSANGWYALHGPSDMSHVCPGQ